MSLVGWANRVEQRYASQISKLFGGKAVNATFMSGPPPGGWQMPNQAGGTIGNTIYLNPSWFRGNKDFGAVIHEIGHTMDYGVGSPAHQEYVSDALRYALAGKNYGSRGNTWTPSAGALAVDKRRGWGTVGTNPYSGNGPKPGAPYNSGRNRNTVGNGAPAMESPMQATETGGNMAQIQYNLAQAMARIRAAAPQLRADFQNQVMQNRQTEISGMAQNVENQIAAGGIGSSADAKMRIGLMSARTSANIAARGVRDQGLLGLGVARADAQNTAYQAIYQQLALQAAQRYEAQNNAFGGGYTMAPTPPPAGNGPPSPYASPYHAQTPAPPGSAGGVYSPGSGWRF